METLSEKRKNIAFLIDHLHKSNDDRIILCNNTMYA
jgi:hypothetical protein